MTRIFIVLLVLTSSLMADLISTTGQIKFDIQMDNQTEMTLNGTGLGIGITPSANLHVNGNAIITKQMFIGGSSGSSNLNVNGTLGYGFKTVSSNTTLGESSIVLVDSSSDNVTITLPYAGNVTGRQYQIKKASTSNSVWVSGGGNLIDDTSLIELPESSDLASIKLISDGSQWYKMGQMGLSETVASNNLVGWWKLDETSGILAYDSSGFENTGTLNGMNFSTDSVQGEIYNALNFSSDYIEIGNPTEYNISRGFSFSLWMSYSLSNGMVFTKFDYARNQRSWRVHLDSAKKLTFSISSDGSNLPLSLVSPSTLSANTIYHISGTYDGYYAKLYIDGIEQASASYSSDIFVSDANVVIGAYEANGSKSTKFSGIIDDVKIYNKSLTNSEIYTLSK